MKKLITMCLCLALVLSFSVCAFADFDQDDADGGTTTLTYTLSNGNGSGSYDNSYVVTIPASVTVGLDSSPATLTVKATGVYILSGKKLQVSIVNADGFNLVNGDSSVAYTVKKGDTAVASGDVILEVAGAGWLADAAGTGGTSVDLSLATTTAEVNKATVAGAHTDTITFTCTCAAAKKLISFTFNCVEYQAEEGMTWGEWADSEYCPSESIGSVVKSGFNSRLNEVIQEGCNEMVTG